VQIRVLHWQGLHLAKKRRFAYKHAFSAFPTSIGPLPGCKATSWLYMAGMDCITGP